MCFIDIKIRKWNFYIDRYFGFIYVYISAYYIGIECCSDVTVICFSNICIGSKHIFLFYPVVPNIIIYSELLSSLLEFDDLLDDEV